jgi:hypothetical protein
MSLLGGLFYFCFCCKIFSVIGLSLKKTEPRTGRPQNLQLHITSSHIIISSNIFYHYLSSLYFAFRTKHFIIFILRTNSVAVITFYILVASFTHKRSSSKFKMCDCLKADLNDEETSKTIVALLDGYAKDFFGGNEPLAAYCRENLVSELRKLSYAHVFLAKATSSGEFVGLAICFEGFSTFACKPLINIHDFYVKAEYRRQGISTALIFFIGNEVTKINKTLAQLECNSSVLP